MNAQDYDEGFKAGYQKGLAIRHWHDWIKLIFVVYGATFLAVATLYLLTWL
jgi:hypothetical protein